MLLLLFSDYDSGMRDLAPVWDALGCMEEGPSSWECTHVHTS